MPDIQGVIRDEKYKSYIGLLCKDMRVDIEKLSDFELFSFLCQNVVYTYGSPLYRAFLSLFEGFIEDIDELCDRELQKKLWRGLNGDVKINFDIAKKCIYNEHKPIINESQTNDVIWINQRLRDRDSLPQNLDELISIVAKSNANIGIDLYDLEFCRPDEYHVNLYYGKLLNGESCNIEELFAISSWMICKVLMRRNAMVYIVPDKSLSIVKSMLKTMNLLKLYPNICIRISERGSVFYACKLCLDAPQKNISLELTDSKETDKYILKDMLNEALALIPATRISVDTQCFKPLI